MNASVADNVLNNLSLPVMKRIKRRSTALNAAKPRFVNSSAVQALLAIRHSVHAHRVQNRVFPEPAKAAVAVCCLNYAYIISWVFEFTAITTCFGLNVSLRYQI